MTDDEQKRVLAAGVEFYSSLKNILEKYDLREGHAPSLVLVAVGAVLSTTNMTVDQLRDGGQTLQKYWSFDLTSELPLNARFDDPSDEVSN
jgi:hypothetical protein